MAKRAQRLNPFQADLPRGPRARIAEDLDQAICLLPLAPARRPNATGEAIGASELFNSWLITRITFFQSLDFLAPQLRRQRPDQQQLVDAAH